MFFIVYIFLRLNIFAKSNTKAMIGIEIISPFKVRTADTEKSANTWQKVFVTEAKSTELAPHISHVKRRGDE